MRPAALRKKVMVVGGGAAGMEAARVSALRGHDVTLYDKSDRLGGALHSAGRAPFKQDIARFLRYQTDQLEKSSVRIRLMTEVTVDLITSENPDVIFVAVGSTPLCEAEIRGLDPGRWVTPEEVYRDNIPSGTHACIVGGGSVGCETALYLAQKGWSVVLVEMLTAVAVDLFTPNRVMLLELLREHDVKVLTLSQVRAITPTSVLVSTPHGEEQFAADLLVLCVGRRPVDGIVHAAQALAKETYLIGDCVAPRKIKDAIWEAFKLAITV